VYSPTVAPLPTADTVPAVTNSGNTCSTRAGKDHSNTTL
jgi:hypothetical protein